MASAFSSRVGTTPRADANCADDLVQPSLVARAFSLLSTLRQQLLQHPANVSAHLPVARSLRFAVAHRFSSLSTAPVFAAGRASVIFNRNVNIQ
jgi:hypothetical protein